MAFPHVCEKAGFKKIGELCHAFNDKPQVMMRLCVYDLKNQIQGAK